MSGRGTDLASAADSLRTQWSPLIAERLAAAGDPGVEALIQAYRSARGRDESENLDLALSRMGRAAVPRLIALLDDPDLSAVATFGLGAIGDRRAVPALMRTARTAAHEVVRGSAVRALGRIRDRRAFAVIVDALADPETRIQATEALARLGDRRAVEALRPYAEGASGSAGYAQMVIRRFERARRPMAEHFVVDRPRAMAERLRAFVSSLQSLSVRMYGEWLGGRPDSVLGVREVFADDDRLILTFDHGEMLEVQAPRAFRMRLDRKSPDDPIVTVAAATSVTWRWYSYGKPATDENRYFIRYEPHDSVVTTTTDFTAHQPGDAARADVPAVALH